MEAAKLAALTDASSALQPEPTNQYHYGPFSAAGYLSKIMSHVLGDVTECLFDRLVQRRSRSASWWDTKSDRLFLGVPDTEDVECEWGRGLPLMLDPSVFVRDRERVQPGTKLHFRIQLALPDTGHPRRPATRWNWVNNVETFRSSMDLVCPADLQGLDRAKVSELRTAITQHFFHASTGERLITHGTLQWHVNGEGKGPPLYELTLLWHVKKPKGFCPPGPEVPERPERPFCVDACFRLPWMKGLVQVVEHPDAVVDKQQTAAFVAKGDYCRDHWNQMWEMRLCVCAKVKGTYKVAKAIDMRGQNFEVTVSHWVYQFAERGIPVYLCSVARSYRKWLGSFPSMNPKHRCERVHRFIEYALEEMAASSELSE
jgi:hypothetical protein